MKFHPYFAAVGLLLALSACRPGAAEYSLSESPKELTLNNASASYAVHFAPGSVRLLPADAARLRSLAASGGLAPSDRVLVAAAGSPALAERRMQAIADQLHDYRIVPETLNLASVPPNQAIVESMRYLITYPHCPDWSKPAAGAFTNTSTSNYGCATAMNLARMVASPADLVEGRELSPTNTIMAVNALGRLYSDRVQLSPSVTLNQTLGSSAYSPPGNTGGTPPPPLTAMFSETYTPGK